MKRVLSAVGLVLAAATSCSPYNYGDEIKAISKSVDGLSTSLTGAYTGLSADYTARVQRYMIEDKSVLKLSSNCRFRVEPLPQDRSKEKKEASDDPPALSPEEKANQAPCVVERGTTGGLPRRPAGPPPAMQDEKTRDKALRAMAALKGYAQGLAAVTNAQDKADYQAAVTKLSASVQAISKLADAAVPGISAIAPAVVNIFGWVVGTSLDQQRFATLKQVVNAVDKPLPESAKTDKPIRIVANFVGLAFDDVTGARLRLLNDEADTLVYPLGRTITGEDAYRQRLTEVNTLVGSIEGLRRSSFAWQGLSEAHDKLVKAVNEGGVNIADLQKAVGEFVEQVEALKTAIDASSKPVAASKKGG